MYVGVYVFDGYWRLVKTFCIWSEAEKYASRKYGYPCRDVLLQITNLQRF